MIAQLEDEIHGFVTRLCDKLLAESGKGPFDVTTAYSCFTSDVIFTYCFGESNGFLQQEGWYPNFREPTLAMIKHTLLFKFFPFLVKMQGVAVLYVQEASGVSLALTSARIDQVSITGSLWADTIIQVP